MIGRLQSGSLFLLGAFLTLAVAGCSARGDTARDPVSAGALVVDQVLQDPLAPGDMIHVSFWREPDLGGEFPVDESGHVVLPILGPVSVSDVPRGELRQVLLDSYSEQLSGVQDVQINMLWRITVLGAVGAPGLYYVDATMTLGDAIAMAGGPTDMARLNGIKVQSDDLTVRKNLGVESLVTEGVRSGDQILVPQITWLKRYGAFILGALISATAIIVTR